MLHVKASTTLQCTLGALIAILLWLNASPAFGDLDASDSANGNYTFNTNTPNPYTSDLYIGGDANIIYQANAQQYVNGANTAVAIAGVSTITVNEGAVIENAYQSVNGAFSLYGTSSTVYNSGTILESGPYEGTGIRSIHDLNVINYATGLISGVTYSVRGFTSLTNYGTLTGDVVGSDGNDTVNLYAGSVINGNINFLGGSSDVLILKDTVAGADGILTSAVSQATELRKEGTNTWTFAPADTNITVFANAININDGTFVNNGKMYGVPTIANGATVKGTGNFIRMSGGDAMTVQSGGTLAPGNSIGTMTLDMATTFDPGSTLQIEVDATGCDKLIVNDGVNVAGDLHIIPLTENVTTDEVTFLESDTSLTGEFANITVDAINTATLTFAVKYYTDHATLQALVSQFEDKAHTRNQHHIGRILDNPPEALFELRDRLRAITDENQLRMEMDHLTTQTAGAPLHTVFASSQQFTTRSMQLAHMAGSGNTTLASAPGQNMLKQLTDEPYSLAQNSGQQPAEQPVINDDPKFHFFASPFGQFGDIDDTNSRTGYNFDAYGAIIGMDYKVATNCSLGLSLGYINTDIDINQAAGNSNTDTLRFGPYATWTNGPWTIDASLTGGIHWIDANLNTIMGTATSDYNSYDITLYGAGSYDMKLGDWTLTPTCAMTYIHQMTDGYTETGAGSANLKVNDLNTDSLESLLGVHARVPVVLGTINLIPEAWIGWQYEWLDRDIDIASTFAASPTTGFTTTSHGTDRSQLVAGAAVFTQLNDDLSLKLNYELNLSSDASIHTVWAMIEMKF